MKTLGILSQKGGVGRTTTSIHLAVEGERRGQEVALIDIDPQASSAVWSDNRSIDYPAVTSVQPTRLAKAIDHARTSGATMVIIDTAPHSADAAVVAAELSDLVLIPTRTGILDLRAIEPTTKIVKIARKRAFILFNCVPPRATRLIADATDYVSQYGIAVAPFIICQRADLGHALTSGHAAQEYDPTGKAAMEVSNLYSWVASELGC